jgi:hypothetical protein
MRNLLSYIECDQEALVSYYLHIWHASHMTGTLALTPPHVPPLCIDGMQLGVYRLSVLAKTVPTVVHKACLAAGERSSVRRRAKAMGTAMSAHFERLQRQPEAYGLMGLGEVFEMREDCLREFRFYDIHACASLSSVGQAPNPEWVALLPIGSRHMYQVVEGRYNVIYRCVAF